MAKINHPPPNPAAWPWGGARQIRERLVTPAQVDRKKAKAGNPKNPALPSLALLDFVGPGHSSDELRLPTPPHPEGHDADLRGFSDRENLKTVAEREDGEQSRTIERSLNMLQATPDRMERMKLLLQREAQMIDLISRVNEEVKEIQQKMKDEQKDNNF